MISNNGETKDFTQTDCVANCEFYAPFGDNKFEILFLNKDANDTKVNEEGKIIEDLAVIVDRILIDELDFTDKVKHDNFYISDGERLHSYGFMYKNGALSYEYVCPGYIFQRHYQFFKRHQ